MDLLNFYINSFIRINTFIHKLLNIIDIILILFEINIIIELKIKFFLLKKCFTNKIFIYDKTFSRGGGGHYQGLSGIKCVNRQKVNIIRVTSELALSESNPFLKKFKM